MKIRRLPAALLLLGLLLAAPTMECDAQEATPPPDDAVNAVARQMYCPVCEGVPLDACETEACRQWREDIRERLAAGWTDEQIKAYFVEQYGAQVLAAPPASGFSLLIYLVPAGGLLLGGVLLVRTLLRWHQSGQIPEEPGASSAGSVDAEQEKTQ